MLRVTTTRAGAVRVDVYDASGRRLRTALNEVLPAGRRDLRLDGGSSGRSLPSGVYFYQVEAAEGEARGKFVVLR
jgi:flagellar hook assembly protein FlgD